MHKSGEYYSFFHNDLPTSYPKIIFPDSLFGLINEFCLDSGIIYKLANYDIKLTNEYFLNNDFKIIIDIKTTELINKVDYYNLTDFPDIIQVAWLITDGYDIIYSESSLNSEISKIIPTEISNLTGINNQKCKSVGRPLSVIADMIIADIQKVNTICSYNLDFNLQCLKNIFFRTSKPFDLKEKKQVFLSKFAFENKKTIKGYDNLIPLNLHTLFLLIFPNTSMKKDNAISDALMTYKIFKELFKLEPKMEITVGLNT